MISRVICLRLALSRVVSAQRFDQFEQADGRKFHFQFSRFDAGEFEEIVGEAGETHGVIADDFQEAAIVFGIVQRACEQCFGEALDGGERRFEFVRNVGDEILTHALEAAQFGDVVKNDDGAGRFSPAARGRMPERPALLRAQR